MTGVPEKRSVTQPASRAETIPFVIHTVLPIHPTQTICLVLISRSFGSIFHFGKRKGESISLVSRLPLAAFSMGCWVASAELLFYCMRSVEWPIYVQEMSGSSYPGREGSPGDILLFLLTFNSGRLPQCLPYWNSHVSRAKCAKP